MQDTKEGGKKQQNPYENSSNGKVFLLNIMLSRTADLLLE